MRIHVKNVWIVVDGKKYYPEDEELIEFISISPKKVTFGVDLECPEPPCPYNKNKVRWWIDKLLDPFGSTNLYYGEVWVGTELEEHSVEIVTKKLPPDKYRFAAASYEPPDYETTEMLKYISFEIREPRHESCSCDIINQVFTNPDETITVHHITKLSNLGAPLECLQYLSAYAGEKIGNVYPECFELTPSEPKPKLSVSSTPSGAKIYLDNTFVGIT